jgi:hypothetical protein
LILVTIWQLIFALFHRLLRVGGTVAGTPFDFNRNNTDEHPSAAFAGGRFALLCRTTPAREAGFGDCHRLVGGFGHHPHPSHRPPSGPNSGARATHTKGASYDDATLLCSHPPWDP